MNSRFPCRPTAGLAVLLVLSACSQLPTGAPQTSSSGLAAHPPNAAVAAQTRPQTAPASITSPAAPAAPAAPVAPAGTAPPGTPPAFDVLTRGAQREAGWLPIWRKQDKVWIELAPDRFGQPLFLSPKLSSGIGEAGIFGGLMQSRSASVGRPQWVAFHRVHQQVQLLAMNAAYVAQSGSPQARAVQQAYSPSLVASLPLASAPHPQTGAVLVDASQWLFTDWIGLSPRLQHAFRQGYALDARNSQILQARPQAGSLVLEARLHYATPSLAQGGSGSNPPVLPRTLPDPRSLFINVHYTLSPLPAQPMRPRPADARVGYFTTTVTDFGQEFTRQPRLRHIHRWRLEKADPTATRSRPKKPIVFWLDPSIPVAYRGAIREGVLAWNSAFEAIGFEDAIQVREAPDAEQFDTLQTEHASIRWMTNARPVFGAIGPSHVDPRTGEILDADIALESLSSRAVRTLRSQFWTPDGVVQSGGEAIEDSVRPSLGHAHEAPHDDACLHGLHAREQLQWGLEALAAERPLAADDPEVEAFVLAYLKDTTMHEVGHALGLRHNFKASTWRSLQAMSHPVLTREQGLAASVMDYLPINLPRPGQSGGAPFQTVLGPYDHWAIAYGYGDHGTDVAAERAALQRLAAQADDPVSGRALRYGTDEDNLLGMDPEVMTFDLGDDPVAFAELRIALVHDLIQRQAARPVQPGDEPGALRRAMALGLRELQRASAVLLRQVGGLHTPRLGADSPRDTLIPQTGEVQHAALRMLAQHILQADVLRLPPDVLRRMGPNHLDRQDDGLDSLVITDFSVADQQLALQRPILQHLMGEPLAMRLLDNAEKLRDQPGAAPGFADVQRHLSRTIWAEADARPDMAAWRRNLQREHAGLLAAAVLRTQHARADTRAVYLQEARWLMDWLRRHPGTGLGPQERVHRQDVLDTLQRAMAASWIRAAG
ncbi:DUF5117 domain-containing protein [Aquabacterium fontiphilum]|uniref:zinc-dependent metalloprotease n=1 Tax=Aquabacterium fontiphilum TaxID=450365 RepID=UPI001378A32C|nr:zinc-dependent metalloprotease [Aquabacterium fontiphilum]NBD20899.1 DUF5117 domain-containing protein [Aquabacterium fontiphilum]